MIRRVNLDEAAPEYDAGDPEGFRSGGLRLGPLVGADRIGASLYELPPGQAICPYHYEYPEEEWLLVLEGRPTLRHPGGEGPLQPQDIVCFPAGPDGAHLVRNDTAETVRVLMLSTKTFPNAAVYPDSDKIGLWTGVDADTIMVRRSSHVDYWDGEVPTRPPG